MLNYLFYYNFVDLLVQLELINNSNSEEQQTLPKDKENLQKKKSLTEKNSFEGSENTDLYCEEQSITTSEQKQIEDEDQHVDSTKKQNHLRESQSNSLVDLVETEKPQTLLGTESVYSGILK